MAVKYKVVARKNPLKPTAAAKFYAQPVSSGEIKLKEINKQINDMTSVNPADSVASLEAFKQVLIKELSKGNIVRFGDFASFQLSFSSEGVDAAEKFNPTLIGDAKIIFRPGPELKDMLKTLVFEKES